MNNTFFFFSISYENTLKPCSHFNRDTKFLKGAVFRIIIFDFNLLFLSTFYPANEFIDFFFNYHLKLIFKSK